jgi:hypoxanthine phosphoribosyltransferase
MIELTDIQIKDLKFTPYLYRNDLRDRIQELAIQINQDYTDKKPLFVSVLNGSFMFTSDLMKQIDLESEIKFIKVSSYDGTKSTNQVKMSNEFGKWVTDRHIIFIEDIIDTGNTMNHLMNEISLWDPASVEIATLFLKSECLDYEINPRYVGFNIQNKFIVGYGLDYDGLGRNYQDIYHIID